uniref:Ribosomal protein L32 n=2 Tax=Taiwania TaxID=25613 RepID=R4L6D7_9CONI|nr:ribosomal protein L33 [Taiwania flousiana]AGL11265.1 ribosomal protein L33 [Taiwania flousiana]AVR43539.1 ribosomal protein L33 [Taiwania cryptomerioides]QJE37057.1 ribosomal protein L32 [Taiwania flousiana]QJE37140.1 ribosomal protein L32 [Taiwania flousiana]
MNSNHYSLWQFQRSVLLNRKKKIVTMFGKEKHIGPQ